MKMAFNHHGNSGEQEVSEMMELMKRFKDERSGKSRREYPDGRISADDDGVITFIVSGDQEKNLVRIDLGKATEWVAMTPQQAIHIAQSLIKQARAVSTEPLSIVLH